MSKSRFADAVEILAHLVLDEDEIAGHDRTLQDDWRPRLGDKKAERVYTVRLVVAMWRKWSKRIVAAVKKIGALDLAQRVLF